jgi:hypothetical protein
VVFSAQISGQSQIFWAQANFWAQAFIGVNLKEWVPKFVD